MSHSRREQTYRDLRDSRPCNCDACQIRHEEDQAERDREATNIANELGDDPRDIGAIAQHIEDADTSRVNITSMDARLAELVDEHDASAPPFPEFARRRTDAQEFDDLEVTRTDLRAMHQEPTWPQVLRMGIVDVAKEVLP